MASSTHCLEHWHLSTSFMYAPALMVLQRAGNQSVTHLQAGHGSHSIVQGQCGEGAGALLQALL